MVGRPVTPLWTAAPAGHRCAPPDRGIPLPPVGSGIPRPGKRGRAWP